MINKANLMERIQKCDDCKTVMEELQQCLENDNEILIVHQLKACYAKHQTEFEKACRHIDCIDYLIYELEKQENLKQ